MTTDMDEKSNDGLTWPQIRYWGLAIVLGVAGFVILIGAQFILSERIRAVVGEFGVASLIAGILAGLVELFSSGAQTRRENDVVYP
jgi:hypothetical protein